MRTQGRIKASELHWRWKQRLEKILSEVRRVEQVGPQVGSELRRGAQLAMLFAIAGLVLCIFPGVLKLNLPCLSRLSPW